MQVIYNIPDNSIADYARSLNVVQGPEETVGEAKARLRAAMRERLFARYIKTRRAEEADTVIIDQDVLTDVTVT